MKKFSAHYILPIVSSPIKNGILVLDDDGRIKELIDTDGKISETDRLEFHSGILIPAIDGLNIAKLLQKQQQMPQLQLNEILKIFSTENEQGFVPGQKIGVFLISSLDLVNLRLTEKSKLKKLV